MGVWYSQNLASESYLSYVHKKEKESEQWLYKGW